MDKKFSVIIPVYNGEKTIARTLASLISSVDEINEVIIVDDYSTDNTLDMIEPFKKFLNIKVYDSIGNKSPSMARKTGMLNAESEWITFVDADDCLTPSSLYYVSKQIDDNPDCILVHTETIYYESGNFEKDDIGYTDVSCGGNFYKREYLINNELFPHEDLYMAEDEYFNEVVIKYIMYIDKEYDEYNIVHYDYPVYEVHHDNDKYTSFALGNWTDYLCKYHLLSREYITDYFIEYENITELLRVEYMDSFIFCFILVQGLMNDKEFKFNINENLKYFNRALKYFKDKFKTDSIELSHYYYTNQQVVDDLLESAKSSIGFDYDIFLSFNNFLRRIDK